MLDFLSIQAKRQFARTLTEQGICQQRDTRVCDMRNVNIVCGREYIVRKYVKCFTRNFEITVKNEWKLIPSNPINHYISVQFMQITFPAHKEV